MSEILVEILADDLVIGDVHLKGSDPGMGVAFGIFRPNANYIPERHATELEGAAVERTGCSALTARDSSGLALSCAGVTLDDFAASLGDVGREIHILGVERYESYFKSPNS